MFCTKLFGKRKKKASATLATLDVLNEALEKLEKRERALLKKVAAEVEQAKEFTRAKNKRAATQCLIRKRKYEQQVEQLGNFQLRIHDQMIMLEGAEATTDTLNALRVGAETMKAMQKSCNMDEVDKILEETNWQADNMKQVQEALSSPIGAGVGYDEDALEAELEDLECAEVDDQLGRLAVPAAPSPVLVSAPAPAPAGRLPARPTAAEEDDVAALRAQLQETL